MTTFAQLASGWPAARRPWPVELGRACAVGQASRAGVKELDGAGRPRRPLVPAEQVSLRGSSDVELATATRASPSEVSGEAGASASSVPRISWNSGAEPPARTTSVSLPPVANGRSRGVRRGEQGAELVRRGVGVRRMKDRPLLTPDGSGGAPS
jgi:hypothetical protein